MTIYFGIGLSIATIMLYVFGDRYTIGEKLTQIAVMTLLWPLCVFGTLYVMIMSKIHKKKVKKEIIALFSPDWVGEWNCDELCMRIGDDYITVIYVMGETYFIVDKPSSEIINKLEQIGDKVHA